MTHLGERSHLPRLQLSVPVFLKQLLNDIVANFREEVGSNLVGIYLHGSLAMGCFNATTSDVDFLVVVKELKTFGRFVDSRLGAWGWVP